MTQNLLNNLEKFKKNLNELDKYDPNVQYVQERIDLFSLICKRLFKDPKENQEMIKIELNIIINELLTYLNSITKGITSFLWSYVKVTSYESKLREFFIKINQYLQDIRLYGQIKQTEQRLIEEFETLVLSESTQQIRQLQESDEDQTRYLFWNQVQQRLTKFCQERGIHASTSELNSLKNEFELDIRGLVSIQRYEEFEKSITDSLIFYDQIRKNEMEFSKEKIVIIRFEEVPQKRAVKYAAKHEFVFQLSQNLDSIMFGRQKDENVSESPFFQENDHIISRKQFELRLNENYNFEIANQSRKNQTALKIDQKPFILRQNCVFSLGLQNNHIVVKDIYPPIRKIQSSYQLNNIHFAEMKQMYGRNNLQFQDNEAFIALEILETEKVYHMDQQIFTIGSSSTDHIIIKKENIVASQLVIEYFHDVGWVCYEMNQSIEGSFFLITELKNQKNLKEYNHQVTLELNEKVTICIDQYQLSCEIQDQF